MRARLGRGLVAVVAALLLGGCPKPPPRSQFPDGAAALDRMKATQACANGVQGEAKIDHFGQQGRVRGNVLLFAVNPARVRIDVLAPLGQMLYSLTSNGREFSMLDFGEQQFLLGPASSCNLARLTQVPIPGHALVYLLRGEAPLLVHERSALALAWESGHYRVDIASTRGAHQTVLLEVYAEDYDKPFAEQRVRVTRVTTVQRGVTLYDAELGHYERAHTAPPRQDEEGIDEDIPPSGPTCDIELPRSLHVVVPPSDDDVVFQYQQVAINPPLVEGAFHQTQPAGTVRRYVDCP